MHTRSEVVGVGGLAGGGEHRPLQVGDQVSETQRAPRYRRWQLLCCGQSDDVSKDVKGIDSAGASLAVEDSGAPQLACAPAAQLATDLDIPGPGQPTPKRAVAVG